VRFPGKRFDMSKGIAIGWAFTSISHHIEATRHSRGSDVLGLIATMLVTGKGGAGSSSGSARVSTSIKALARGWPFGFARQTLIFSSCRRSTRRCACGCAGAGSGIHAPSVHRGSRIPTNIPQANDSHRRRRAVGGIPITSITEIRSTCR